MDLVVDNTVDVGMGGMGVRMYTPYGELVYMYFGIVCISFVI